MKSRKLVLVIVFVALLVSITFAVTFAATTDIQTSGSAATIFSNNGSAYLVIVDPGITVSGDSFTDAKVMISNFDPGRDKMGCTNSLPAGVSASFSDTAGILTISATNPITMSASTLSDILRTVYFYTTSLNTNNRIITFSLGNAIPYSVDGQDHYYEYVDEKLSWTAAKTAAEGKTLYGMQGYLATITSQGENDFIFNKLKSDAWIGGSDDFTTVAGAGISVSGYTSQADFEGNWYWVTGPQAERIQFSQGDYPSTTLTYDNWNDSGGSNLEPNNSGGVENFAEIYCTGAAGKWNDLADVVPYPPGYVVEYGGMEDDTGINLQASVTLTADTTAPTASVSGGSNEWTSGSRTITISNASDSGAGLADAPYSFDGGDSWQAENTKTYNSTMNVIIKPIVRDAAGNSLTLTGQIIKIDQEAPSSPSISINGGAAYTRVNTVTLGLSASDFSPMQMIISEDSNFVGANYEDYNESKNYTLSIGGGTKTVYVKYKDSAGNVSDVVSDSIVLDQTRPTVTISSSEVSPTNASTIPITITFSEDVTDFNWWEITTNGTGQVSGFSGSGATYTANVTPNADGTVTVDVGNSAALDYAGNGSVAATTFTIVSDQTAPTVSISSSESDPTNAFPIPITITFSEDVTGFAVDDISVGNGTAGNLIISNGATYTADITPTADGTVTVYVDSAVAEDSAGNDNTAATTFSIESDRTLPDQTSINIDAPHIVNGEKYTNSTAVTLALGATGADEMIISEDSSFSDAAYIPYSTSHPFTLSTDEGTKTIYVKYKDLAGNVSDAISDTIELDTVLPTVSISSSNPVSVNGRPVPVTIIFSENVTGFTIDDISLDNGTADNFSGNGSIYTVYVTPVDNGNVTVHIDAAKASDYAGNSNTGSPEDLVIIRRRIVFRPPNEIQISDMVFGDSEVYVSFTEEKNTLPDYTMGALVNMGKSRKIVVNGNGFRITIPMGTLKLGDDINDMIPDLSGMTFGNDMVVYYTDSDGIKHIVPWSFTDGGKLNFIAEGNWKYGITENDVTFSDTAGQWAEDAIEFVAARGLFNGTGDNSFSPELATTRGMMVTVLYRLNGMKEGVPNDFGDVNEGYWYSEAIDWGEINDIARGYGNGDFGPMDYVTREQLVTLIYRYAEFRGEDRLDAGSLMGFSDSDKVSDYALKAMGWAVQAGIIEGRTNGELDPGGLATRAEVAAVFDRFIKWTLED